MHFDAIELFLPTWSPGFYHPRSITIRVPVTIERVVDFDAAGRVVELHSRRLLDDDDED